MSARFRLVWLVLALPLLLLAHTTPVLAEELVAEFRGSVSRNTPEFEVKGPWLVDWRVTTEGTRDAAVEVTLERAGLGSHEGRVLMTKTPGNGVRLLQATGRFYFRVDASLSNWHLKVIQLTAEEAERYTPKER